MKKYVYLSAVAALSIVSASTATQAADTDVSKTRTANVELLEGTTPEIPEIPSPSPSTGPYVPVGSLGISSATDLYFDAIELSSNATTRQALYVDQATGLPIANLADPGPAPTVDPATSYVPGFSVTDRRGSGAGWNLSLKLGAFIEQNAAATPKELKGAQLTFPQVTPITAASASPAPENVPTTQMVTFDAGGASQSVMVAQVDQGLGVWEARYHSRALTLPDSSTSLVQPIELKVPGDNYKGQYQAELLWNLSDSPTATPAI